MKSMVIKRIIVLGLFLSIFFVKAFFVKANQEFDKSETASYTVEFMYNDKQYTMEGNSKIDLNVILKELNLNGKIEKVEISNLDFLSYSVVSDKWIIESKKPFKTKEWMNVTLNGTEHKIILTDALQIEEGLFGNAGWGGGSNKCWWNFSDDGTLVIRPLNSANAAGGCYISKWYDNNTSSRADKTQITNTMYQWPWLKYKSQIKKIVMTGKFYTDNRLNFNKLFEGYPLLTEFDSSGLQLSTANGNTGQTFFSKVEQANSMFANCPELVRVDLSGFTNNGIIWDIRKMFANDPKLTTVIINNENFKTRASASNGIMMSDMFSGSNNIEYVDFSNISLFGRPTLNSGTFMGFENLFKDKTKLHTVLLNNTIVEGMKSFESTFEGCIALNNWDGNRGLSMNNFKPKDAIDMRNMFKGCTGFTKLDLSNFGKLSKIVNMDGLIEGCSNLEELVLDNLDNSAIGPYATNHAINKPSTNQFPSSLYPNNKEYNQTGDIVSRADSLITGAVEYGREIFGKGEYNIPTAFKKLRKISAQKSNIWMAKNNRGTAGNEYYNAGSDSEILYLFNTKTDITPDGKSKITIDTKRDYIDMITDRDGINKHTINPSVSTLPDAEENLNIKYNYNLNGAGHLAAGVYEISKEDWVDEKIEIPDTYYRIAYIGDVPFKIEGIEASAYGQTGNDPELILQKSENFAWLNTRSDINWPSSGNYTIDRTNNPIKITYENAAIDVNGKKHNVVITIKKITFKNLEKIPLHAGSTVIHDSNRYIDYHPTSESNQYNQNQWTTTNTGYYRNILSASRSDGVNFRNYVRVGDGNTKIGSKNDWQVLSGGSGTDIDFTIEIEGANPNTSFIFHAEDLDIAESQEWIRPNNDHDFEHLPVENLTYGIEGESFVLGDGNDLNSVKFAKQTGLKLLSDTRTIITTGTDPNTPWSKFAVKANAKGANYRWKSGIGCNTYALINTSSQAVGKIEIQPIVKVFKDGILQKDQFEFTLEADKSVEGNKATGTFTSKNDENGNVEFSAFKFETPSVEIDGNTYYPGTNNDATNTHGEGTHNTYIYAWIIKEIAGEDKLIQYDLTPRKLKVVISTPENDAEMLKGIKAEIYVNNVLTDTVWSSEVTDNKYIKAILFENVSLKEIVLRANWNDLNMSEDRPDDLNGFVQYENLTSSGKEVRTLKTNPNDWVKLDNNWIYRFNIPKSAVVIDWGEDREPKYYKLTEKKHIDDSTEYEITNSVKRFDLSISKEVFGNIADKDKEFAFNIRIYDDEKKMVSGKMIVSSNGVEKEIHVTDKGISIKLKHGDTFVIKNIKDKFMYEITEEDTEYVEFYQVVSSSKDIITNKTKGQIVNGFIEQDLAITFINENEKKEEFIPNEKNEEQDKQKEEPIDVSEPEQELPDVPKTYDNVILYILMLTLSILGLIGLTIHISKKNS